MKYRILEMQGRFFPQVWKEKTDTYELYDCFISLSGHDSYESALNVLKFHKDRVKEKNGILIDKIHEVNL